MQSYTVSMEVCFEGADTEMEIAYVAMDYDIEYDPGDYWTPSFSSIIASEPYLADEFIYRGQVFVIGTLVSELPTEILSDMEITETELVWELQDKALEQGAD